MSEHLFGAPAALTGAELVTIHQAQNSNLVLCSMPLSVLLLWIQGQGTGNQALFDQMAAAWLRSLPTTVPTQGPWLNGGVVSYVP